MANEFYRKPGDLKPSVAAGLVTHAVLYNPNSEATWDLLDQVARDAHEGVQESQEAVRRVEQATAHL